MRILHLGKYYPPHKGGIEKTTLDIVEGLNDLSVECNVLVLADLNENFDYTQKNYKVYTSTTQLKAFSGALSIQYLKLFNRIAKEYDIIHVHFPNPIASLALLITRPKAKIIIHWHSDIVNKPLLYFFYKPLERKVLKMAANIIGTTQNYIENSAPLKDFQGKCRVLPSCCEPVPLKKGIDLNERYKTFEKRFIIFSLGRLVPYKGFEYLIESAKYLHESCLILIGGDGPLRENLKKKIRDENVSNKVSLLGPLSENELVDLYNLCHVFCLPSVHKSEAFGLVQCEAFSIGKPVISTSIEGSGVSWVNQHDQTGKIVPPKSAIHLARAIEELRLNPDLYSKLSVQAKNRYQNLFRKELMINKVIEYYKNIIV